jgi:hypothetical protein
MSGIEIFGEYLRTGFVHVIPLGYDHILFILALFFLNSNIRTAILQCSVFTIAHSVTLAMAALGYIHISSGIVESVIALSIYFVAFENLFQPTLKPWRIALVFFFGLVHGIGFASALSSIGIPEGEFIPALIGFNFGVELAQISIILFCYYAIARNFREKAWYRTKFVQPLSLAIACMALFWSVERYLGN